MNTVYACLASLPLFSEISPEEIGRIAEGTLEIRVSRGGMVFRQGDPARGIHIVVTGQVKLALPLPEGGEKVVQIVGPRCSFGEALMFMEKPYIVSAQALKDSLLLHVCKETLFEEIERDPKFARKMLTGLSRRLHLLINDVESYSRRSAAQRLIGYLLGLEEETAPDSAAPPRVILPASKGIIASRLNLSQEHFSRTLRDLVEQGLIAVSGRMITLLDVEKLRGYRP